jgi:mannose-6-phosphate isomerase-like protein (cupin superfamily)
MRHFLRAMLLLVLTGDLAGAQQFVAKVDSSARAPEVAPPVSRGAARRAAKREAERRRRTVDFVRGEKITGDAASWLGSGRLVGTTLLTSADEQTAYVLVRRTISSKPEVHARWDDLVIVRSGTGAIELGDSLSGSTYRAPGERAGGSIVGTYRIVVHAGDIVRIPAAVPHAFVVTSTEALEYLLIKNRRQELPIRWFGER